MERLDWCLSSIVEFLNSNTPIKGQWTVESHLTTNTLFPHLLTYINNPELLNSSCCFSTSNIYMDKAAGESRIFLDDDDNGDAINNGNEFAKPAEHEDNEISENGHRDVGHLLIKEAELTPESSAKHTHKHDLHLVKRNSVSFKLRRRYMFWSSEEIHALEKGVKKYGHGNWSLILHKKRKVFKRRTPVDLKDKWRNMGNHFEDSG